MKRTACFSLFFIILAVFFSYCSYTPGNGNNNNNNDNHNSSVVSNSAGSSTGVSSSLNSSIISTGSSSIGSAGSISSSGNSSSLIISSSTASVSISSSAVSSILSSGSVSSGASSLITSSSMSSISFSSSVPSSSSTATACSFPGSPAAGTGEFTAYYFGQGTATGSGCPSYKTFFGYCGTETTNKVTLCSNTPSYPVDTINYIAYTNYFAAISAAMSGWINHGGECVEITHGSSTITATIVDECVTCSTAGHIDLSASAYAALGYSSEDVTGTTWKFVPCPVTGNIIFHFNNGYSGQLYFENTISPVQSVTINGYVCTRSQYAYWDAGSAAAGKTCVLTDIQGNSVSFTIGSTDNGTGANSGVQFPGCL